MQPFWAAHSLPMGPIPSGSADGMIPAYTGGITKPPEGYVAGGDHIDPVCR